MVSRRTWAQPGNFVAGLGNYWIDRTSKMLEFERTCQVPHARVYYELLCDEPGQTLSDILEFLKLSPDGSIISRTFTSDHGRGPGDYKIDYTVDPRRLDRQRIDAATNARSERRSSG